MIDYNEPKSSPVTRHSIKPPMHPEDRAVRFSIIAVNVTAILFVCWMIGFFERNYSQPTFSPNTVCAPVSPVEGQAGG